MELSVCIADAAAVIFSLIVAGALRYGSFERWNSVEDVRMVCGVTILIHIVLFYSMKVTDGFFRRGRYKELVLCMKYNAMMVVGIGFSGFALKNELIMSRLMMGYFFLFNTLLLWVVHIVLRNKERVFRIIAKGQKGLLIVATSEEIDEVVKTFLRAKEVIWNVTGIVVLDGKKYASDIHGIPVLDLEDDYFSFASRQVVDEVFIRVSSIQKNERVLQKMILEFENMGLVVNLNLDLFNLGYSGEKRIYPLEGYHVVAFSNRLLDYRAVLLKRAVDIIGGIVGLCITIPVGMILGPFLLSESPGPLIFKQKRIGQNGREFYIYKFRSMYADAESRKKDLAGKNEMKGPVFKIEDDPRITKVGHFIRKTSIDELPQFWNVLKGDMSLVGTRPPTVDEFRQYEAYQRRRMSFRPGITGLWQISGRSDIKDFDEIVKMDLEYIDNWSLILDLKIILKTIGVVFKGEGAS